VWRCVIVTAVILINTEPAHTAAVAVSLSEMKGVSEVYSVAGNYDLVALVRVSENEALADLVGEAIRGVQGITRTETLIAFRVYSRHDLDSLFGVD
jgi:DNA-binding Lrp family transcriptional regulator